MTFLEYEVVRLRRARPHDGLRAGDHGTVLMVFRDPPAYEVEFCNEDGVTIALLTLKEDDLESAGSPPPPG